MVQIYLECKKQDATFPGTSIRFHSDLRFKQITLNCVLRLQNEGIAYQKFGPVGFVFHNSVNMVSEGPT